MIVDSKKKIHASTKVALLGLLAEIIFLGLGLSDPMIWQLAAALAAAGSFVWSIVLWRKERRTGSASNVALWLVVFGVVIILFFGLAPLFG